MSKIPFGDSRGDPLFHPIFMWINLAFWNFDSSCHLEGTKSNKEKDNVPSPLMLVILYISIVFANALLEFPIRSFFQIFSVGFYVPVMLCL